MKFVDVVQLTRDAIAQTMGADYQPLADTSNEDLASLPSQKLVDIGEDVTAESTISGFTLNMITLIGKHVIENRLYEPHTYGLMVESFDWGGFIERTRVGLGEIIADPMWNKTVGTSYADIEHTYYGQDVKSKLYGEAKAIMCPLSIEREQIKEAFTSWDKMNEYISAKERKIQSTLNLALEVYSKMLLGCGVAMSDKATGTAVHLITEAVSAGVLDQIVEDDTPRNPTYSEVFNNKAFLAFVAQRIKQVLSYMCEITTAFNDESIPTWCEGRPNLVMLDDLRSNIEFYVKADTFNPEYIGIGEFNSIVSWQGVRDGVSAFDRDTLSTVSIAADATNKLGIGTAEYTKSGVVGLAFDPMAIGMCLYRQKVTSSYTACADFWNSFYHMLVNYLVDSSYGMVAFIMD